MLRRAFPVETSEKAWKRHSSISGKSGKKRKIIWFLWKSTIHVNRLFHHRNHINFPFLPLFPEMEECHFRAYPGFPGCFYRKILMLNTPTKILNFNLEKVPVKFFIRFFDPFEKSFVKKNFISKRFFLSILKFFLILGLVNISST